MAIVLSILLGIGLAAAVGLRVFVPFLLVALVAHGGHVPLAPHFAWLATRPALVMLAVATVAEVAAYHVPGLDHALDVIAGPAAVIGGILLVAATAVPLDPAIRWTLAIIAGGGVAGLVQTGTAGLRVGSTITTGGFANPLLATAETGGAVVLTGLALVMPVLVLVAVVPIVVLVRRRRHRRPA